jgi:biopolymer transport protein ExbB
MEIVERLSGIADYGARWVLWLLIGLSVVALAVIIERAVLFFSSRENIPKLVREVRNLLEMGDVASALSRLEASPSFEARVAAAGLVCADFDGADERMLAERELVRLNLERRLAILSTLGSNAPFVGLLGTVIGIVRSFQALENARAQVSASLMTEIGEALIATAVGLLVALPAVAAFNTFQRVVKSRLGQAEVLRHEVLSHWKMARASEVARG